MTSGVKALGSTLGSAAAGGLKIFAAGVSAAASGVAALGTAAIKSYAEYEQLVGGVETLFGTRGAKSVEEYAELVGESVDYVSAEFDMLQAAQSEAMDNAANAYKTAGLSANDYMETISGFAASLKQSCVSELEAAEAADQAVIDMADNANKMGTDMEAIQNAYQGFAKQNYTMLDNLKLGYGGTKTEMERLLADATALSGVEYDIDSLYDVYSAIHVIQDELGITGTTAKEASTTISGSLNMTKAAWSNLLTGIADDNADFDTLVQNFVDSVAVTAENILPRVEIALGGIGQLIEQLLPIIVAKIPDLINNGIPDLLETGANLITTLLNGIQQNLPQIVTGVVNIANQFVTTFITMMPQILQMGLQIITNLAIGIGQALPTLIPTIINVLLELVDTLIDNIDMIIDAAMQLIQGLADGIVEALPVLIEKAPDIIMNLVDALIEALPKLIESAEKIITTLAEGITENLPKLINEIPPLVVKIVTALIENAPKLAKAALQFITIIARALINNVPKLLAEVPKIVTNLLNCFLDLASKIAEVGSEYVKSIKESISNKWSEITSSVGEWVGNLVRSFTDQIAEFINIGADIVENIWNGISNAWGWLTDKVSGAVDDLGGNDKSKSTSSSKNSGVKGAQKSVAGMSDQSVATQYLSGYKGAHINGYSVTAGNAYATAPIINYDKMAGAVLTAFEQAGIKIEIGQREFGRIVKEVIT